MKDATIDAAHGNALTRHAAPYEGARLRGIARLRDALPDHDPALLLHAGPPFEDSVLPAPVRNAAIHALVVEGRAEGAADAAHQLDGGHVRMAPAQDHGVVTPLAQVVSASMAVLQVGDDESACLAPLAEGPPPALRFGSPDPACVMRALDCAEMALAHLAPALAGRPVAIAPIVLAALAGGDECHSRTGIANRALVDALGDIGVNEAALAAIRVNAGFMLPILMAASAWALGRQGRDRPGAIVAGGGNGRRFGLRLAGENRWHTAPANPPTGLRLPGTPADARVLGAIGDSAVIDLCGLGGQALALAPELAAEWAGLLPPDWAVRAQACVDPFTSMVDAARVSAHGLPPSIHLAMLDAAGLHGLLGRGFYTPPVALFARDGPG